MRRVRFVLAPVLALLSTLLLAPAASAADRDCGDFDTQRAAQRFFLNHNPKADPHGLDGEGDGVACESNPCPCSTNTRPGTTDGQTRPEQIRQHARVVEVIDGDTVDVRISSRVHRVRMIGIDTPEVYGGVECGGKQASRSLRRLLPRGARVLLLSDTSQDTRDRYGRQLRYVHRRGSDVNKAQVRRGWARVYVYDNNPFNRTAEYRRAQRAARTAHQGVWRAC
jgi:endonuclease YncB( thermonuclease family)